MTILLFLLFAPLVLINLTFVAEAIFGLRRGAIRPWPEQPFTAAIIVPAHDEAALIGQTLKSLIAAVGTGGTILVVADNCVDGTADIARQAGASVIERHNAGARGKGHALAFARDWLRQRPPSAVIVLDADCHTDAASLRALADFSARTNLPCQAINLLEARLSASPMVQISTFAFLLKNLVRQRGLQRLCGGVHLTGTGMCMPWEHFDRAELATSSIVEDIQLGLELAQRGARPQLIENAFVWSPSNDARGTLIQRRRWEGGYLAMARSSAFETLVTGLKRKNARIVMSGLDLFIPPLALLAALNAAALLICLVLAAIGWAGWIPAMSLIFVATLMVFAILAAWAREGKAYLTLGTLVRLPFYVIWKMPMYLGLARLGAPSDWLRTDRSTGTDRED